MAQQLSQHPKELEMLTMMLFHNLSALLKQTYGEETTLAVAVVLSTLSGIPNEKPAVRAFAARHTNVLATVRDLLLATKDQKATRENLAALSAFIDLREKDGVPGVERFLALGLYVASSPEKDEILSLFRENVSHSKPQVSVPTQTNSKGCLLNLVGLIAVIGSSIAAIVIIFK